MVSLLKISFVSLLMFIVVLVQSETLIKTTNDINETKSPINNQQLYELYKIMRSNPRLASVSNQDIVAYIYRNYVHGNGIDIVDYVKPKDVKQHRHRHRKIDQTK